MSNSTAKNKLVDCMQQNDVIWVHMAPNIAQISWTHPAEWYSDVNKSSRMTFSYEHIQQNDIQLWTHPAEWHSDVNTPSRMMFSCEHIQQNDVQLRTNPAEWHSVVNTSSRMTFSCEHIQQNGIQMWTHPAEWCSAVNTSSRMTFGCQHIQQNAIWFMTAVHSTVRLVVYLQQNYVIQSGTAQNCQISWLHTTECQYIVICLCVNYAFFATFW